jgi:ribosome biogenesis GTPase / thiamine phosphate phosphatase
MNLHSLGWNSYFESQFENYKSQGFIAARVVRENRQIYLINVGAGELSAEITGRLYYLSESPADLPSVGDWVAAVPLPAEQKALIHAVLPRKNKFSRSMAGGRTDEQIVAANVDVAFIVTGLDPDFNVRRIERYLVLAHESGVMPVIVLNKSDVCEDVAERIRAVERISGNTPIHAVSAKENLGMEPLVKHIPEGKTAVLLGSSGAGKSTIINKLVGFDRQFVNTTRESDGRGQHTTTFRELIMIPDGGMIIDNPGMRELKLWNSQESVSETFEDIEKLAADCRFRNCKHQTEPCCAILSAIEEGIMDAGHLENYRKLQKEVRFLERRQNQKMRLAERSMTKAARGFHKDSKEVCR